MTTVYIVHLGENYSFQVCGIFTSRELIDIKSFFDEYSDAEQVSVVEYTINSTPIWYSNSDEGKYRIYHKNGSITKSWILK